MRFGPNRCGPIGMLINFLTELSDGGNHLLTEGAQPDLVETLGRTKVMELVGETNVSTAPPEIGASLDDAWEVARRRVGSDHRGEGSPGAV